MSEKCDIILVGGGGHCRAVIDVIEAEGRFRIAGIIDLKERIHERVLGYEVIASDDELPRLAREYRNFLITIGQVKSAQLRKERFEGLKALGVQFPVIVSPLARVSDHSTVGEGSVVMHFALVNAGARVGKNGIINSHALIEHDARIGDHCHVSTGALVNGAAAVGDETFVGSGSVVSHDVTVPAGSIVGAGAAMLRSPESSGTFVGRPARKVGA